MRYGSVFKGRSMDFDDLREYVIGDDTKDIDWKSNGECAAAILSSVGILLFESTIFY